METNPLPLTKLQLKVGQVEILFEGTEEFLAKELPVLLTTVVDLTKNSLSKPAMFDTGGFGVSDQADEIGVSQDLSVSTIAARISAKSGQMVALAAAYRLTVFEGKGKFSRKELVEAMNSAPSHNKKTFISNLSYTLRTMIANGDFNQQGDGKYSLSDKAKSAVAQILEK